MNRRELMLAAVGSTTPLLAAQSTPAQRPNVLWICTDQQRWDTITALGNHHVRTPNLDRLAAQGVAFTHAYCQNPICTPSRASFMTGCYPSFVHVHRNGNARVPAELPSRLFPRLLSRGGYDCALVGKMHLSGAYGRVEPRLEDGYRIFEWSHAPEPEPFWPVEAHAYQRWLRDRGVSWTRAYRAKKIAGYPEPFQAGITAADHEVTWASERAQALLSGTMRAPWLISMHTFAPHPPFAPPPEYLERMDASAMPLPVFSAADAVQQERFSVIDHQTQQARPPESYPARPMVASYYAQIEHIDHEVGRVLEALDRSGQRDNTIVVFTSDHGEMLGDHGLLYKGCRFYEGAVRVPLLVSWPARFRQGVRSDALVELIDVVPTLCEAAGLDVPSDIQGRSLLSILTGRSTAHREFVWSEFHDTLNMPDHSHATMLRDRRYKIVLYHGHDLGELYDLEKDPQEIRNLWEEPSVAHVRTDLTRRVLDAAMLATDLGGPLSGRY